jgi:hypothetical protein
VVRTGDRHFDNYCLAVIGKAAEKAAQALETRLAEKDR